jgi:hypothetical protein
VEASEYCLLFAQSMCMPRSDWAAWVQAVGSIGAIASGVLAINWQVKHQAVQQRTSELREEVAAVDEMRHFLLEIKRLCELGEQATDSIDGYQAYVLNDAVSGGPVRKLSIAFDTMSVTDFKGAYLKFIFLDARSLVLEARSIHDRDYQEVACRRPFTIPMLNRSHSSYAELVRKAEAHILDMEVKVIELTGRA